MTSWRGSQAPQVRGHLQVPTCTPVLPYRPATQREDNQGAPSPVPHLSALQMLSLAREENQGAPSPVPHLSALQMLSLASRGSLQPHSVPNPTRLEPLCENPRSYSITPSHVPAHSSVHWACPDPQRSSAGSSLPGLPRWRKLSPTTTTIPNLNVTSLTLQRSHLPHPTELRCSQL